MTKVVVGLPVQQWPYAIPGCEHKPCMKCQQLTWVYTEYLKDGTPLLCKVCAIAMYKTTSTND